MQEASLPASALSDTCPFLLSHMVLCPANYRPLLYQCPHLCFLYVWEPQVWWKHFSFLFGFLLKLLPNKQYYCEVVTYFGIVKANG